LFQAWIDGAKAFYIKKIALNLQKISFAKTLIEAHLLDTRACAGSFATDTKMKRKSQKPAAKKTPAPVKQDTAQKPELKAEKPGSVKPK